MGGNGVWRRTEVRDRGGVFARLCSLVEVEGRPIGEHAIGLSGYAYLRREGGSVMLRCPFVQASVSFCSEGARRYAGGLLGGAVPQTAAEREVAGFVVASGLGIEWPNGLPPQVDDAAPAAQSGWRFEDLVCHAGRTAGTHRGAYGQTYRDAPRRAPLPVDRASWNEDRIALARSGVRDYAGSARRFDVPDLATLGRFLDRLVAERERYVAGHHEVSRRGYPSGGAVHELEWYLAIGRCHGLASGLWHYHPGSHTVGRVPGASGECFAELSHRSMGGAGGDPPPIVVLLAARFFRVFFKYEAIGYGLILQNAGVALGLAHHAAEREGLALCGNGLLPGLEFARAIGIDPQVEGLVAMFALGAKRGVC